MRPNRFPRLWYVRRRACNYIASKPTLSPNILKRNSTVCHLGVPSGASKMISEPMVRLAQTMHLSCVEVNTISKRTKTSFPLHPCHLGVPSGASKLIYEPMARLAQIVHLSCVEPNTFSKLNETSLHLTHFTYEFQQVRPK